MSLPATYSNASGVSVTANAGTYAASGANSTVTQNEFLSLLVTEMKNQDPTQPVNQTQTLTQLAQFSELEQMTNLNATATTNSSYSQISQDAGLIGKTVTTSGTGSTPGVSGVVSGVTITSGKAYLQINGQSVDATTVTQIQ